MWSPDTAVALSGSLLKLSVTTVSWLLKFVNSFYKLIEFQRFDPMPSQFAGHQPSQSFDGLH
jgi:hypothetical protein